MKKMHRIPAIAIPSHAFSRFPSSSAIHDSPSPRKLLMPLATRLWCSSCLPLARLGDELDRLVKRRYGVKPTGWFCVRVGPGSRCGGGREQEEGIGGVFLPQEVRLTAAAVAGGRRLEEGCCGGGVEG